MEKQVILKSISHHSLWPKISIVTPSYNQGEFIEETIKSVLSQDYSNFEYIIIDGGSTDGSVEIIKNYEQHLSFWVSEKDMGQSHAINKGFNKCSGEIVCWLNSDDLLEQGALHRVAKAFVEDKANVVVGRCIMFSSDNIENTLLLDSGSISFYSMLRFWKNHFCPPQPSIFFKRSVLEEVGYLNEELHYGMDLDLWLRMAYKYSFHSLPLILSKYRIHDNSKTGSDNGFGKFQEEWIKIIQKNFKKLPYMMKVRYHIEMRMASLRKRLFPNEISVLKRFV